MKTSDGPIAEPDGLEHLSREELLAEMGLSLGMKLHNFPRIREQE